MSGIIDHDDDDDEFYGPLVYDRSRERGGGEVLVLGLYNTKSESLSRSIVKVSFVTVIFLRIVKLTGNKS